MAENVPTSELAAVRIPVEADLSAARAEFESFVADAEARVAKLGEAFAAAMRLPERDGGGEGGRSDAAEPAGGAVAPAGAGEEGGGDSVADALRTVADRLGVLIDRTERPEASPKIDLPDGLRPETRSLLEPFTVKDMERTVDDTLTKTEQSRQLREIGDTLKDILAALQDK